MFCLGENSVPFHVLEKACSTFKRFPVYCFLTVFINLWLSSSHWYLVFPRPPSKIHNATTRSWSCASKTCSFFRHITTKTNFKDIHARKSLKMTKIFVSIKIIAALNTQFSYLVRGFFHLTTWLQLLRATWCLLVTSFYLQKKNLHLSKNKLFHLI